MRRLLLLFVFITFLSAVPVVSQSAPPDRVLESIKTNTKFPSGIQPGSTPSWLEEFKASQGSVEYPYDPTMPVELTFTSEANRNVAKYWNYRDKLRKNFIKVTTAQGGCLPVQEILEFQAEVDGEAGTARLGHWGDATLKLGWYIGVLSTELHMLTSLTNSGNAKQFVEYGGPGRLHNVKVELYCSMLALERLDQFGENHLWQDHPIKEMEVLGMKIFGTDLLPMWPNNPGFFIRDDVGKELALTENTGVSTGGMGFQAFWSDLTPIPRSADQLPEGDAEAEAQDKLLESYLNIFEYTNGASDVPKRKLKQMSQDQAIHVIMGLGLAKRFIPPYVSYNGINLRDWAISKTEDIVDWISQTSDDDFVPPSYAWTILDPVTPAIRYFGDCPLCVPWFDPFHPAKERSELDRVARGSKTYAFAAGINIAGERITGKRRAILPLYDQIWQRIPEVSIGAEAFATFLSEVADAVGDPRDKGSLADNVHMTMALGAISDGWGARTLSTLNALSLFEDFYIYPLVNSAVYDRSLPFWVETKIAAMLRGAPYDGVSVPEPVPDQGWGSENRFIRAKSLHGGESAEGPLRDVINNAYRRRFHGLDYMLLHNLYYIQYPEKFKHVIYADDAGLPNLEEPDWPAPPDIKLPPIGYAAPEGFNVINQCRPNAAVQVPITVEYEDPHGDRDTVSIHPIQDGIGLITSREKKNKFLYTGPFWGKWDWKIHPGFRLIDEDNNHYDINVEWNYPGAVRTPPVLGHHISGLDATVDAWWQGVPVWGRIEADYTVYAIDKNCVPWQEAAWAVVGMQNVYAYKTGQNGLHATAGWSLLDLHGSGKVTILAVNKAGGPTTLYDIHVSW